MLASVVIPIGPYHFDIAERAIESAKAQTIPCEIIPVYDNEGRGPSWARNEGTRRASGLFVIWLDADDWLKEYYLETIIQFYEPGFYCYSDHEMDNELQKCSPCVDWRSGNWHGVTTLFPKVLFDWLGGFRDVPQAEDSEFYIRAQSRGICGIHAPYPLFTYGAGGRRSQDFHNQHDKAGRDAILAGFLKDNPTVQRCGIC